MCLHTIDIETENDINCKGSIIFSSHMEWIFYSDVSNHSSWRERIFTSRLQIWKHATYWVCKSLDCKRDGLQEFSNKVVFLRRGNAILAKIGLE